MTRILVWQWGRRGAGPQLARDYADAFAALPGVTAFLSLSRQAEIMQGDAAPFCDFAVDTYVDLASFGRRVARAPFDLPRFARHVQALAPDLALCAMPGPLDLAMHAALRRCGVRYAVAVHDAQAHPGDGYPFQMRLQAALVERADALVALSRHVAGSLIAAGQVGGRPLIRSHLPPMPLPHDGPMPLPRAHGGRLRLLSFGRLLPYKGLDLLAEVMCGLMPRADLELRVVGSGPESDALDTLRRLDGVGVENRWVPQEEIASLLAWSDAVILSHTEASQSGIVVAARSAGRDIVATNVGGLPEQLEGAPRAILCAPNAASLRDGVLRLLALPPPGDTLSAGEDFSVEAQRLLTALQAALTPGAGA